VAVAFLGVMASIAGMVAVLGRLNEAYRSNRRERGLDDVGPLALEIVLSVSAIVAVAGFALWFFVFAGAEPVPFFGGP